MKMEAFIQPGYSFSKPISLKPVVNKVQPKPLIIAHYSLNKPHKAGVLITQDNFKNQKN